MPPVQTEGPHAGEFIVSEANGSRSREKGILGVGNNLKAGAVLGKLTSGGDYAEYDNGASDGSQTAVAILYDDVDATAADAECVVIARDAEVNKSELQFESGQSAGDKAAAYVDLAAVGIIARDAV